MEAKNASLMETVRTLEEALNASRSQLANSADEKGMYIRDIDTERGNLKLEVSDQRRRIDILEADKALLEQNTESLIRNHQHELESIRLEKQMLSEEINELKGAVSSGQSKLVGDDKRQMDALQEENSKLESHLSTLHDEILRKQVAAAAPV